MEHMSKLKEKFDLAHDNRHYMKLCLDVTLYFWGSFKEHGEGLVDFYQQSIELIGKEAKFYKTEKTGYKKIKKDTLEMLPFWATEKASERLTYGLHLESGKEPEDYSDRAFHMYQNFDDQGYIRLILPVEYMEKSVEPFISLAKNLARRMRFASGHAGYSANVDPDLGTEDEGGPVYALSRRYKGVDFGEPQAIARAINQGIKSINWLTFINTGYVNKLGGKDKLKANLGENILVHELSHGIMIQAGPRPEVGDANQREKLPYYHRVGKVLKEIRFPNEAIGDYELVGSPEYTAEWLARFDK